MNILKNVKSLFNLFVKTRFFYSLYFNFRYLPFDQAKRLPIRFYSKAYATIGKTAKITLTDNFIASKEKVHIGFAAKDFEYGCETTHLAIPFGEFIINGKFEARRGCQFDIRGKFTTGNDVLFGPRCRIRIHNNGEIGSEVRIAHETQVFDSNFHYTESVAQPGFISVSKPIFIGSRCWIGNRSTIGPGAYLPDYTTVTSSSLVNKNFSTLNPYSTIGGIPAKFIREGYTRVWDTKREVEYNKIEFNWYNKQ